MCGILMILEKKALSNVCFQLQGLPHCLFQWLGLIAGVSDCKHLNIVCGISHVCCHILKRC